MPWSPGAVLTAAQLNTYVPQAAVAYTPTWGVLSGGTAPALGNGSLTGSYFAYGKLIVGRIRLVAGSTTTYGSGSYTFSLPFAAATSTLGSIGTAALVDTGVAGYYRFAGLATATTFVLADASAANWTPTTPFTFGNSDTVSVSFTYEAA